MELIQEVGAYVGFAAVVGLAVLAALYFSQARDVRRLREWAGRAPERSATQVLSAEQAARAAARPAAGAVRPVAQAQGVPAAKGVPAGQGAKLGPGAKPATVPGAAPAPATGGAVPVPAQAGAKPAGVPVPAEVGVKPATATAAAKPAPAPARPTPPPPAPVRRQPIPSRQQPQAGAGARERGVTTHRARGGRRSSFAAVLAVVAVVGAVLVFAGIQLFGGGDEPAPERAGEQQGGTGSTRNASAVDPASVTVAILNGTTVQGLAAQIGDTVEAEGFQLGNVTNATEQGERAESAALYVPGSKAEARSVARKLEISQIEPIDAESQELAGDASVVVIVGLDQTQ